MVKKHQSKGISVIYVILIATIIFAIAIGINSIALQQSKTMREIGYSLIAFYLADAGSEGQLYSLYRTDPPVSVTDSGDDWKYGSYVATSRCSELMDPADCRGVPQATVDNPCANGDSEIHFCITSIGTYIYNNNNEMKRAIELKF